MSDNDRYLIALADMAGAFGLVQLPGNWRSMPPDQQLKIAATAAKSIEQRKTQPAVAEFLKMAPAPPGKDDTVTPRLLSDGDRMVPAVPMPKDNSREVFVAEFRAAARAIPEIPKAMTWGDAGVVLCAGGWRYMVGAYVACGMIRDVSDLPIQVWHAPGEVDDHQRAVMADWPGVTLVDAGDHLAAWPMQTVTGWPIKALAAMAAPFSIVYFFDADCYPVADLEAIGDSQQFQESGATFWPDLPWGDVHPDQFWHFGLTREKETGWESGQFVVDKRRHWPALWLSWWLNARSEYVYKILYGDKDTFHIAWRQLGDVVTFPVQRPKWYKVAFCHDDYSDRPFCVHRVFDKPRIPINGVQFIFRQQDGDQGASCRRVEGLPGETRFWQLLNQCRDSCRRLGIAP